jgi:HSP90 family molecular chaperone
MEYHPRILLTFFREGKVVRAVRIDDNGVGMDLSDVQDTVLWIGSSIADNADVAELVQQAAGKNLIATFGIGLLSCFKASGRITVRTAKEGSIPVGFELTSVSDAVRPEKSNDAGIGSTIIVELQQGGIEINPKVSVPHHFKLIKTG